MGQAFIPGIAEIVCLCSARSMASAEDLRFGDWIHLQASSLPCLEVDLGLSARVAGWSTFVWPLHVARVSFQHGGWIP